MPLVVKKDHVVKACVLLGMHDAGNWPDAKLLNKLGKFPKLATEDKLSAMTPKARENITSWIEQIKAGETPTLSGSAPAADAAAKTSPKAAAPAKGAKAPKAEKAPKEAKGPGVIASIIEFLQKASKTNPIDKAGILAKLVARFPERGEDQMKTTVGIQVPSRLNQEKAEVMGGTIEKNEKGYFIKK